MIHEAVRVSNAYQQEIFLENNRLRANSVIHAESDDPNNASRQVNKDVIEDATKDITSSKDISVHHVHVKNHCGEVVGELHQGEEFEVEVQLSSGVTLPNLSVGIIIKDRLGIDLTGESNFNKFRNGMTLRQGQVATVSFRSKLLLSGGQNYAIALSLNNVSKWDRSDHILLYRDDASAVFKVIADLEEPMWFKFYQNFEVNIDVR